MRMRLLFTLKITTHLSFYSHLSRIIILGTARRIFAVVHFAGAMLSETETQVSAVFSRHHVSLHSADHRHTADSVWLRSSSTARTARRLLLSARH